MNDFMMAAIRETANEVTMERIKNGELTLESDDIGLIPAFLSANIISNPQILDILEVMAGEIMKDGMEKEYVVFFLNKIRELVNKFMKDMV